MKMVKNTLMIGGLMGVMMMGMAFTNKRVRKKAEKMLDTMLDEAQDTMQDMKEM